MSDVAEIDTAGKERQAARDQAVRLLARRDHSRLELRRKLVERGHAEVPIEDTLAWLTANGLQSDERFADAYVRSALNRGCGERKIRAALAERGVASQLTANLLNIGDEEWLRLATTALRKRFRGVPAGSRPEAAKRLRFLLGRGFGSATAARAIGLEGNYGCAAD